MIAVLLAIAVTTLAGAAVARTIDADAPIGLWYLYGCGVMTLVLQVLPWSRALVIAIAVLSIAALTIRRRAVRPRLRLSPVDAGTLLVLAVFGVFATIKALWEWDAWAIWALKGRVFFEHAGVDWRFLEADVNAFAHPDYPLFMPINLALPSVVAGVWDDRWLGIIVVAILLSASLAVREITARDFSPHISASIALSLVALGSSRYVGTAETALIALAVAALAFLRAGEWRHAAILLGLAATTKNEGMALLVAVVVGLLMTRLARNIVRLWPALAIAAPWLILRALHRVSTDVVAGPVLGRLTQHLAESSAIVRLLVIHSDPRFLWIAIIAALLVTFRRERLLFTIVAVQCAICVSAYFLTPYDAAWHVSTSWDRVSRQIAAMAAYAALVALAEVSFAPRKRGEGAEGG